jgi:NAD(P)-dependent dehydrogenase (short-subunit alcohol dehydrogenase family)
LTELGKKAWGAGKVRDAMLSQIPVGRFAEPDEIAQSIAFIVRDESGMINGADIRIDGGFTIR